MSNSKQKHGTRIGSYLGKPIFEFFQNQNGTYIFNRIAQAVDDEFPLDQLDKDELLLSPGLIYKQG